MSRIKDEYVNDPVGTLVMIALACALFGVALVAIGFGAGMLKVVILG